MSTSTGKGIQILENNGRTEGITVNSVSSK
jgi:hypothetical protein